MPSKKTNDPRHQRRIKLMQLLFAHTFVGSGEPDDLDQSKKDMETIEQVLSELEKIDPQISQYAPERPLADINQVDLAVLRLIIWEAEHKKTPKKVLIDEAVELAKEFGSESSPRFVNGVLGKLLMDN
ncbi:MAG: transcription antitermination factor NusB [Patescibacteria group bacterium]|nr:transcription antitermination factor NusB [Patescibacteria group bacterium]